MFNFDLGPPPDQRELAENVCEKCPHPNGCPPGYCFPFDPPKLKRTTKGWVVMVGDRVAWGPGSALDAGIKIDTILGKRPATEEDADIAEWLDKDNGRGWLIPPRHEGE